MSCVNASRPSKRLVSDNFFPREIVIGSLLAQYDLTSINSKDSAFFAAANRYSFVSIVSEF